MPYSILRGEKMEYFVSDTYIQKRYRWNSVIKLTGIQDAGGAQDIMPCISNHTLLNFEVKYGGGLDGG